MANGRERAFDDVRHRTVRSKGCLSKRTALAMIFKLAEAAEKMSCADDEAYLVGRLLLDGLSCHRGCSTEQNTYYYNNLLLYHFRSDGLFSCRPY